MQIISIVAHLFEFFILFVYCSTVFKPKKNYLFIVASGLFAYSVILIFFLVFDSTILNIVTAAIFNFLFCFLLYRCKIKEALFSSLLLSVALTASEFIAISLFTIKDGDISKFNSTLLSYIIAVTFSRLIYLIIILSIGLILRKSKNNKMPFFLFFFPIASIVFLYTLWLTAAQSKISQGTSYLIITSSFCVIISILLTYIFYGKTSRELNELYKNKSESDRIKADEAYYEILDKQNEQLKTIIHDEKNHLAAIKSLANKQEVSEYIDTIFGQIEENSVFGNTKNKILDLTINKYQYICDSENIDFYISIKTSNLIQIEKPDLITLLGNLLDNAVESAKKSKGRKIDLSINKTNGFDVLTCTNSCDIKPRHVGEELESTKTSSGFHGLGVKSIKRIVKKYHGNFEWKYDETKKEFIIYIVF